MHKREGGPNVLFYMRHETLFIESYNGAETTCTKRKNEIIKHFKLVRNDICVNAKRKRSGIDVNSMWNQSEAEVNEKWNLSEREAQPMLIRSDT